MWASGLALSVALQSNVIDQTLSFTSADGLTWTLTTITHAQNHAWEALAWSTELGLLVAVASSGPDSRIMTSTNGTTWTLRTTPVFNQWKGVAWSPELGLFAAVADSGVGNRAMTSPDGVTWTSRTTPTPDSSFESIAWSCPWGLFVATASDNGGRVMTSADGVTWVYGTNPPTLRPWRGITWAREPGVFVVVGDGGGDTNRAMISDPPMFPPVVGGRHYEDQIMMSLFTREASYDSAVAVAASTTCAMRDFDDDSAHEEWDDLVEDDAPLVHGKEYPTQQEIVRQSVRLTYREPRTKPNTLAGLMGLALGSITSVKDGAANAWRHKLVKTASVSMPSISLQTRHARGSQYRYTGTKSDGFTLQGAGGPYLSFETPLIGSGSRARATDTFPAEVDERWLLWGDAHVYWAAMPSPMTLPTNPVQGATNLGGGATEISTRLISNFQVQHGSSLLDQMGYRPSTGKVRGHLHPLKRGTQVTLEIEVNFDLEETEIDRYFNQTKLALELNLDSGTLIAPAGTYKYGLVLIIPRLQFKRVMYDEKNQTETLVLEGTVLSDQSNPELAVWCFNATPAYLA